MFKFFSYSGFISAIAFFIIAIMSFSTSAVSGITYLFASAQGIFIGIAFLTLDTMQHSIGRNVADTLENGKKLKKLQDTIDKLEKNISTKK